MSRELPEWIGKNDNTPVPPRVRLRAFLRFGGVCQECGVKISGKRWICDHRIALINGGANRESNLGPIHEACNKVKTALDVREKSKVYRAAAKDAGIRKPSRLRSRGFEKSVPQRSASRPIERIRSGKVWIVR